MTRQDCEQLAVMAEKFIESDREFMEEYSTKAGRVKMKHLERCFLRSLLHSSLIA